MKRLLSGLLAVLLLLCLGGCGGDEDVALKDTDSSTTSSVLPSAVETSSPTSTEVASKTAMTLSQTKGQGKGTTTSVKPRTTTTTQPSSGEETIPDYALLSARQVADGQWQTIQIHNPATDIRLQLDIPSDWTLAAKDSRTWMIRRSGKAIGVVTTSALAEPKDYFAPAGGGSNEECIDFIRQINWHKENGKDRFYRYYEFNCTPERYSFSVKLRVDYAELDDTAAATLADSALTVPQEEPFVPLSQTNGSKKILILGNSFIMTSQIGDFLNDMLTTSGGEYTAEAVSRGMAEVQTFADDADLCQSIRNGEYAYVFQCGLYSEEALTALGSMRNHCRASNTPLVIFPAHNEGQSLINEAQETYDDLCLLDWKGEINTLIDDGVSYSSFCEDDYHKHSTPLAGYVGAHMIYRTLFDKNPPRITDLSPLSWGEVRSALGGYAEKGSDYFAFTGKTYAIQ